MENKTLLIVVGVLLVYLLFIRKPASKTYVPAAAAGALKSPKPAVPQPTTAQIAVADGIKAAPQVIKALGSFLSSDSSSSDDSDSAASTDDLDSILSSSD